MSRVRALAVGLAAVLAVSLGGCGVEDTAVPTPPAPPEVTGGAAPAAQDCKNRLQSYAPDAADPLAIPSGSTMSDIRQRGRLIAGVSADTYLLGARNPVTGEIEGFDIDFVSRSRRPSSATRTATSCG